MVLLTIKFWQGLYSLFPNIIKIEKAMGPMTHILRLNRNRYVAA